MSKYVMVAFDDDETADHFVTSLAQGSVFFESKNSSGEGGVYGYIDPDKSFVRGVWKRPTLFCTCMEGKPFPRDRGMTRSKNWKWYVCTKCAKADAYWARGGGWLAQLGRNLLPVTTATPEWRGDKTPSEHVLDLTEGLWQSVVTGEYLRDSKLQFEIPGGTFAYQYNKTDESIAGG